MLRALAVVLAVVAACGRVDFDALDGDGADAAARDCRAAWAGGAPTFSGIAPIAGLDESGSTEKNPFLAADGTTLYLSSTRAGGQGAGDLWSAHLVGPATAVIDGPIAGLSSTGDDERVEISADGHAAVLSSNRNGGLGGYDLWFATFDGAAWTVDETAGAALDTATDDKDPHWSADRDTLYFNHASTLEVATRADPGTAFDAGVPFASGIGLAGVADPWVSADGLLLVFSAAPAGDYELYTASRTSTATPFADPIALAALSSPADDQDVFVTADACSVWFASARAGDFDIYVATVAPP